MKHLLLLLLLLQAFLPPSFGLDCGDGKVRGVNLGGWLLLEPWITPKFFEEVNVGENAGLIVDEWTYAQYMDPVVGMERKIKHWDEFYSREDIELLANAGISHLRIPVGYWMLDVDESFEPFPPPPQTDDEGLRFYLKRLLGWCRELDLKVLIDLHGAPGSQNGYDNSGRRGDPEWNTPDNVDRTLDILDQLSSLLNDWKLGGVFGEDTLYGVELLNEPRGYAPTEDIWVTCRDDFYYRGYDVIRSTFPWDEGPNNGVRVSIQQAFRNSSEFHDYMPESDGYFGVSLDMHVYHGFGYYWNHVTETDPDAWETHLKGACDYINEVQQQTLDTFTGEWSLALTNCQKYVEGGYADPYDPPNLEDPDAVCGYYNSDWSTYTDEYKEFLRVFMLAQLDSAEAGAGFYFWTAKTEDNCAPEWDLLFLIANGVAPLNFCTRETYCQ